MTRVLDHQSRVSDVSIQTWLDQAAKRLGQAGVASARLDALLLLSDAVGRDKAWLLAHCEQTVDQKSLLALNARLVRRVKREPMAYIRGRQDFFGRTFTVNQNVLIPRPETETIVELLLELPGPRTAKLLDVGTGSGCIAITAKLELPNLKVYGTDMSPQALAIARYNATALGSAVGFRQQDLMSAEDRGPFGYIVANLPYVNPAWRRSPETAFEPKEALFADDNGLTLIKKLITQASSQLASDGYLILEADTSQHQAISAHAQPMYKLVRQRDLIVVLQRY